MACPAATSATRRGTPDLLADEGRLRAAGAAFEHRRRPGGGVIERDGDAPGSAGVRCRTQ
jgi:hypothetical protein